MLIGLGFFTVSIIWSIYNVAVPRYLDYLGLSGVMVGAVMTIDNVFAIIFLPLFGTLSDKTNTRYGRRMPFLLVGIPLSAIAFFLIPIAKGSLFTLMLTVILLNFFMSIYRAPTVALMPDFTPHELRSKANGIINFMGGLGASVAFLLGGVLFGINDMLPFATGSGILIVTIIVMYMFVKEPKNINVEKPGEKEEDKPAKASKGQFLSLIFLLLAIFFWFSAFNAVETFFSTYAEVILGVNKSMASFLLLTVSLLFLIFAIPAGIIAGRFGRKKTILTGILVMGSAYLSLVFIRNTSVMFGILGIAGISWALININSYPMVVEMTTNKMIGKYTGYYYFFSMLASIVSPILYGALKDWFGDEIMFVYSLVCMVFAFFFMMLVKHGEVKNKTQSAFESIEHMEA